MLKELHTNVYRVRDLITEIESNVHASRLKFYADDKLEVTEGLKSYLIYSQQGYELESIQAYDGTRRTSAGSFWCDG